MTFPTMSFFVQFREKPHAKINKLPWKNWFGYIFLCPPAKGHGLGDDWRIALLGESLALDKYPHCSPPSRPLCARQVHLNGSESHGLKATNRLWLFHHPIPPTWSRITEYSPGVRVWKRLPVASRVVSVTQYPSGRTTRRR